MYDVLGTSGTNRVILRYKFGVSRTNGQTHGRPDRAGPSEGWTITFTCVAMQSVRIDWIRVYDVNVAPLTMNTVDCTAHILHQVIIVQ